MKKTFFKITVNKYCLPLMLLLIFSGCSSSEKKNELLSLQKRRIQKLETQLEKKEQVIQKLKTDRWLNKPIHKHEKLALLPLNKLIKDKRWAQALRLSSELKKSYPNSVKLRVQRYKIFSKLGLKKQALNERRAAKKLLLGRRKGSSVNNVVK